MDLLVGLSVASICLKVLIESNKGVGAGRFKKEKRVQLKGPLVKSVHYTTQRPHLPLPTKKKKE